MNPDLGVKIDRPPLCAADATRNNADLRGLPLKG
jgi:hypothetical protein